MNRMSFSTIFLFAIALFFVGFVNAAPAIRKAPKTPVYTKPSPSKDYEAHGPVIVASPTPDMDDDTMDEDSDSTPEPVAEPSSSPEIVPDPYCKKFGC